MASSESGRAWTARRRFTYLTLGVTALLISWGGFVTSIDAGMAVPDWPASFGSYDPFRTGLPDWYTYTPVLAEHGHRLLGALVGILTVILGVWTWVKDPRRWMRWLGVAAVVWVSLQGLLGGLRVTENSIALAAVHACTAQIFVAMLAGMALFTTDTWRKGLGVVPSAGCGNTLREVAYAATGMLYLQIVLGALLRQFGQGIDAVFASIHIAGAFVVTGLVFATFVLVEKHFDDRRALRRGAWAMLIAVGAQFALGLAAYLVMLNDLALAVRSALQIGLTVGHLVVGAVLMAATIMTTLLAARTPGTRPAGSPVKATGAAAKGGDHSPREPVIADRSRSAQSES